MFRPLICAPSRASFGLRGSIFRRNGQSNRQEQELTRARGWDRSHTDLWSPWLYWAKWRFAPRSRLKEESLFKQRYVTLLQLFNIFFITTIPRFGRLTGKNINPTLFYPFGPKARSVRIRPAPPWRKVVRCKIFSPFPHLFFRLNLLPQNK